MAKKKTIAVAITPDRGLEVAEMDYMSGTIIKYTQKDLGVVTLKTVIPDMDVFKDLLQECFAELGVPKGSQIVLCLPTVSMGMGSYMSSQTDASIVQQISNDLIDNDLIFRDNDPLVVTTGLSLSIQSKVVAYTASVYSVIQEAARMLIDLGYKIKAIDVSASSVLRGLIHSGKVQTEFDTTWLMLLVDNGHARIFALNDDHLIEYKEEQMMYDYSDTVGNCEMVASTVSHYFEKVPAKYLFVVSRTDSVPAEMLASKIKYENPIIFLDANSYSKETFVNTSGIPEDIAEKISLELIGAALYEEKGLHFNLFDKELGDVYTSQQPPSVTIGGKTYILTDEFVYKICAIIVLPLILIAAFGYYYFNGQNSAIETEIADWQTKTKAKQLEAAKFKVDTGDKFSEIDEINMGLARNTELYSFLDLIGRDMPQKMWLNHLTLANLSEKATSIHVDIEGHADNIESIYTFYRNIKDSVGSTKVQLQKLSLATVKSASEDFSFDDDLPANSGDFIENSNEIMLSSNADFYEFIISEKSPKELEKMKKTVSSDSKNKKKKKK